MRAAATLFAIGAIATGCATSQAPMNELSRSYEYSPDRSLALNVTQAAGIKGLTDLPREEYEALVEENPELRGIDPRSVDAPGGPGEVLGTGVAGVAGALDPIHQIGSLGTGLIDAAFWMSGDNRSMSQKNRRIIWLPEGTTLLDYERAMTVAAYRLFEGDDAEYEVAMKDWTFNPDRLTAGSPECITDDPKAINADCGYYLDPNRYSVNPRDDHGTPRDDFELPPLTDAPEFLKGIDKARGPIVAYSWVNAPDDAEYMEPLAFSVRLSERSPDYVFSYVTDIGDAYVTPRVYQAGKAHYFVEP